jgi:hypothetical protein
VLSQSLASQPHPTRLLQLCCDLLLQFDILAGIAVGFTVVPQGMVSLQSCDCISSVALAQFSA